MSITKKILIGFLVFFILIQFFKPAKNQSLKDSGNDIFSHYQTEQNTKMLVQTACYDCHSNNTVYPWYAEIQPVAWWLDHHIVEAKAELNFSEFKSYPAKKADHKLEEVIELIEDEEMPLKSYLLTHHEARLTPEQRETIIKWAKDLRGQILPAVK